MEVLVEKEIIGYGGSSVTSVLTNIPIKPRSLKLFIDIGTLINAVDDGAGNIIGTGVSGTISYSTGEINFTLSSGVIVIAYVSYTYFSIGITELNKVQYSNEDFETNVESIKELIRKNYNDEFNDYTNSSLGMALIDILGYVGQNLSWYMNRKLTDMYFSTARTPITVSKVARTLGYKPEGARSAQVNLGVAFKNGAYGFPITIEKPFAFKGPNGLQFEYRNNVPIVFNAGDTYKTFDVNEGQSVVDNFVANGQTNQIFYLRRVTTGKYIEEASVVVKINGVPWTEYPIIPFEKIAAFETNILSTPPFIKFGDGIQGQVPANGAGIEISYVICSGFNGRVAKDSITAPLNPLNVNFTEIGLLISQPSASIGGDNPEDTRAITVNAPLFQKTQDRAITKGDYDFLANTYPNVAKANAQVIRSIKEDVNIQQFLSYMNNYILNLKNADRYLQPRPQISKLVFSENLFDQNMVMVNIDSSVYTQSFLTNNTTTLTTLAALLQTNIKIASAVVSEYSNGNSIVITGKSDVDFSITVFPVEGGLVPVVSITELTSAPSQSQRISFDKDLFFGNVIDLTYDTTPISIPFDTDSATTLTNLGNAISNFAKAPVGKWKEVSTSPAQQIEITFDKLFFNGCLIQLKIKDLSEATPVETLIETSYRTSNAVTLGDLRASLEQLSFVKTALYTSPSTILITTNTERPEQLSGEIVGFGDGSRTVYSFTLANTPIKLNSINIRAGSVVVTENPSIPGQLVGIGISSGTIDKSTGLINITYSTAPAVGTTIYASYTHYSSLVTLEITSINVLFNTVTVDTTARTIDVITDGSGSLLLTGASVSVKTPPILSTTQIQSMIAEDLGSVAGIATNIETQMSNLETYLSQSYSDGCRSNTVQVSVLSIDAAKKYAVPTQSLLDGLNTYLSARKDAVHHIETISGYDNVINVDMDVEILTAVNSVQDEIVKKTERALVQADSLPYGLMVQRDFNKSLYISEVFDAIQSYVSDNERDYLNIVIKGPAKHSTGFIENELIGIGEDGLTELSVIATLKNNPVVSGEVKIAVNGVEAGYDDGEGVILAATGVPMYIAEGRVDYQAGVVNIVITPAPTVGIPVTINYYASKIDSRGNYICPQGYVLQYGTVIVRPLSRS